MIVLDVRRDVASSPRPGSRLARAQRPERRAGRTVRRARPGRERGGPGAVPAAVRRARPTRSAMRPDLGSAPGRRSRARRWSRCRRIAATAATPLLKHRYRHTAPPHRSSQGRNANRAVYRADRALRNPTSHLCVTGVGTTWVRVHQRWLTMNVDLPLHPNPTMLTRTSRQGRRK